MTDVLQRGDGTKQAAVLVAHVCTDTQFSYPIALVHIFLHNDLVKLLILKETVESSPSKVFYTGTILAF